MPEKPIYMDKKVSTINSLAAYLAAISKRGDHYWGNGGIFDLLRWCDKPNTQSVTLEEAERFFEDPSQPYEAAEKDENL